MLLDTVCQDEQTNVTCARSVARMVEKINACRPTLLVIKPNRRRPRDLPPTRRWKDNITTYLKDVEPKCILRHLDDQFRKNDMGGACGTIRDSRVV